MHYVKYDTINLLLEIQFGKCIIKKGAVTMKGLVKNGQTVTGLRYQGKQTIIIEANENFDKEDMPVVFISDGQHIDVNEGKISWHDPGMKWKDLEKYFPNARVFQIYLRRGYNGLKQAAEEVKNYADGDEKIRGRVLFIGHSKSGLMFYQAVEMLDQSKITPVLISVSTPFGGTPMSKKTVFQGIHKRFAPFMNWVQSKMCSEHSGDLEISLGAKYLDTIKALPDGIKHYAVVSTLDNIWQYKSGVDFLLKIFDWACFPNGDGIVSKGAQEKLPIGSQAVKIYITASHANSLEEAIKSVIPKIQ